MVPTFCGPWFVTTVTLKVCSAVSGPSLAVTVITAEPTILPLMVTVSPDIVESTTSVAVFLMVYVKVLPSGSLK